MVCGRIFEPPVKDFADVLEESGGVINKIASHYGVKRETVYHYIERHPDFKERIKVLRGYVYETMLDKAESVLMYCMNQVEKNPKMAQDTSKYVLDKRGSKRGWGDGAQNASQEKIKSQLEDLSSWTDEAYENLKQIKDI